MHFCYCSILFPRDFNAYKMPRINRKEHLWKDEIWLKHWCKCFHLCFIALNFILKQLLDRTADHDLTITDKLSNGMLTICLKVHACRFFFCSVFYIFFYKPSYEILTLLRYVFTFNYSSWNKGRTKMYLGQHDNRFNCVYANWNAAPEGHRLQFADIIMCLVHNQCFIQLLYSSPVTCNMILNDVLKL